MQACSATEQTQMEVFLEQMGAMHCDSMQASITSILARQKTIESEECVNWLRTTPRKPLWQMAVLVLLVNDGLIVYDATAGETDAEHVMLDPGLVAMVRDDAAQGRLDLVPATDASAGPAAQGADDDAGAFERELELLAI